jgi:hypothetical protein
MPSQPAYPFLCISHTPSVSASMPALGRFDGVKDT